MTQSKLPYAWIYTYKGYRGGTEPPRGKKTEEEKGENICNTVWLVDCEKMEEQQASVLKALISPSNYYINYIILYNTTIQ